VHSKRVKYSPSQDRDSYGTPGRNREIILDLDVGVGRHRRCRSLLGKADVVCISATPPGAMMHARYLCRQLRRRFPKVKLIVGLWDFSGDLSKVSERIGNGAIVVATLTGAQEKVRLLIQESLLQIEPQVSPESGPVIVQRSHPSHVEVRSTLQRALPANAIDVGTKSNCGQAAARGESPAS
jgi:hypothetical protein